MKLYQIDCSPVGDSAGAPHKIFVVAQSSLEANRKVVKMFQNDFPDMNIRAIEVTFLQVLVDGVIV